MAVEQVVQVAEQAGQVIEVAVEQDIFLLQTM
jgi:hypothetical protein